MTKEAHANEQRVPSANASGPTGYFGRWLAIPLWKRTLLGLVIGCFLGAIWPDGADLVEPIGDLFLRSIKMLVAPLVFATIVAGIAAMGDVSKIGAMGVRVLLFYFVTTAIAIVIGLIAASFLPSTAEFKVEDAAVEVPDALETTLSERLLNMVPSNPFESLATGNVFQIIVFAFLVGIGILVAGNRGAEFARAISSFAEVMLKVTMLVMELAPFGVFALMSNTVSNYGMESLSSLLTLILVYYAACLFHMIVTYGGLLKFFVGLSPFRFFQGVLGAQAVAFSTTSSSATLPVTLKCAQGNLGVGNSTASFVLPLGATVNMDGTGIYLGVMTVFASQMAGVAMSLTDSLELIVAATLASVGIAGVPGGSLVMLSTVLLAIDLPLEIFALVAGVDRILDMARTTVNVTGDALASVYVGKSIGDFDNSTYNEPPSS